MIEGVQRAVQSKRMLSVDEQIAHLIGKGIKFEECSEEEACKYLSEKNNFYKVTSYRKLFDVRRGGVHSGEYAHLDFAYLKDLAAIDCQLRYTFLPITLDIEHFAKVNLLKFAAESNGEDGYSIVEDYINSKSDDRKRRIERELDIMKMDHYCGDMVTKYRNDLPIWVFVEAVSFGTLIDFHKFCAERWRCSTLRENHYLLKQVKSVRNASAHSSNMINGFSGMRSTFKNYEPVSAALVSAGFSKAQRRTKMSIVPIQQIVTTLFAYNRIVTGETSRNRAQVNLYQLKERMLLNEAYYAKNDTIRSSFEFLEKLFDRWF